MVGLGNIGRAIAKRGRAFDMNVIAIDVHEVPKPDYVTELRLSDGLDDLLRRSDVVAVTTPRTPKTGGLLGEQQLTLMKRTSYLLVVSRGGIVDEDALARMLREGRLAGAGLDVTATEPLTGRQPALGYAELAANAALLRAGLRLPPPVLRLFFMRIYDATSLESRSRIW